MEFNFNSKLEDYYKKFIELQEKLKTSEEERFKLEMKFTEMMHVAREEEQAHYRKLRSQYKKFLDEDKKRQDRNERIIRNLDRIETRFSMLAAKTERVDMLRRQYQNYLWRISNQKKKSSDKAQLVKEKSFVRDGVLKKKPEEFSYGKSKESLDLKKPIYENPTVKKALEKDRSNEEKIEILDKYLQSISSQRCRDLLNQEIETQEKSFDMPSEKFFKDTNDLGSNHANAIADDIMSSIYSRYYKKDDVLPKPIENVGKNDDNHKNYVDDLLKAKVDRNQGVVKDIIVKSDGKCDSELETAKVGVDWNEVFVNGFGDDKETNKDTICKPEHGERVVKGVASAPFKIAEYEKGLFENDGETFKEETAAIHNKILGENINVEVIDSNQFQKAKNIINNNTCENIIESDIFNPAFKTVNINENPQPVEGNNQQNGDQEYISGNSIQKDPKLVKDEANQDLNNPKEYLQISQIVTDSTIDQNHIEKNHDDSNQLQKFYDETDNIYDSQNQALEYDQNEHQPVVYDQNKSVKYDQDKQSTISYDQNGQHLQYDQNQPVQYYQNEHVQDDENKQNILLPQYDQSTYDQTRECVPQYDQKRQPIQYDHGDIPNLGLYVQPDQPVSYDLTSEPDPRYDQNIPPIKYNEGNNQISGQYVQPDQPVPYDPTNKTDPQYDHNRQSIQYDEGGNPIPVEYDQSEQPIMSYDQTNESVPQYDQNGQQIQYDNQQYDQYGQPILYDHNGQIVQPQYDETGQIIPQYNENGKIIVLYDQNGQQVYGGEYKGDQQYDPNNQLEAQQYDADGQPIYEHNQQYYDYSNQNQGYDKAQYDQYQRNDQGDYVKGYDDTQGNESVKEVENDQYQKNNQGEFEGYDETHGNQNVEEVRKDQYQRNTQGEYVEGYDETHENQNVEEVGKDQYQRNNQGEYVESYDKTQRNQNDQNQVEGIYQFQKIENDQDKDLQLNDEEKHDDPKKVEKKEEILKPSNVMEMLDTDTESAKQNTSKISNDSDFDFS